MIQDTISMKIGASRYYNTEIAIAWVLSIAILTVSGFFASEKFIIMYFLLVIAPILLFSLILQMKDYLGKSGTMTFSSTRIEISRKTSVNINYIDIQKIAVRFTGAKGDFGSLVRNKTGRENTIKIITKDGKKTIKHIWCLDKWDYWQMLLLEDFLKEKGVEIEMKGFSKSRNREVTHWVETMKRNARVPQNPHNPPRP